MSLSEESQPRVYAAGAGLSSRRARPAGMLHAVSSAMLVSASLRSSLILMVALGLSACEDPSPRAAVAQRDAPAAPEQPPPPPAWVASPPTDTVPLETLLLWTAAHAQRALASEGIEHRVLRSSVEYAGLLNGVALDLGSGEVHLFFYGDIGAVDRAYRQLDPRALRPIGTFAGGLPPQLGINNNMLAVFYGGDEPSRRRAWHALTPGSEVGDPEAVEP